VARSRQSLYVSQAQKVDHTDMAECAHHTCCSCCRLAAGSLKATHVPCLPASRRAPCPAWSPAGWRSSGQSAPTACCADSPGPTVAAAAAGRSTETGLMACWASENSTEVERPAVPGTVARNLLMHRSLQRHRDLHNKCLVPCQPPHTILFNCQQHPMCMSKVLRAAGIKQPSTTSRRSPLLCPAAA
jgi:hypothetical protein